MKEVQQSKHRPPLKRINGKNTCFTDSIAFLLGQDPKDTPFFIGYKNFIVETKKYFTKRGYKIKPREYKPYMLSDENELYLVQGLSRRSKVKASASFAKRRQGINHCVVYLGKKPIMGGKLKGTPLFVWQITPPIKVSNDKI